MRSSIVPRFETSPRRSKLPRICPRARTAAAGPTDSGRSRSGVRAQGSTTQGRRYSRSRETREDETVAPMVSGCTPASALSSASPETSIGELDRFLVSYARRVGLEAHRARLWRITMEGHVDELRQKLASLLTEAAEVSVALDRANGT